MRTYWSRPPRAHPRTKISIFIVLMGLLAIGFQVLFAQGALASPPAFSAVDAAQSGGEGSVESGAEQEGAGDYRPKVFIEIDGPGTARVGEELTLRFSVANSPFNESELLASGRPTAASPTATPTSKLETAADESALSVSQSPREDARQKAWRTLLMRAAFAGLAGAVLGWISSLLLEVKSWIAIIASLITAVLAAVFFTFVFDSQTSSDLSAGPPSTSTPTPTSTPSPSPTPTENPAARRLRLFGDQSAVSEIQVIDEQAESITYQSGDLNDDEVLQEGETWIYEATYTIVSGSLNPLLVTATVEGVDLDGDHVSGSNTFSLAVEYETGIALESELPAEANIGETLTYTLTVTVDEPAGDGSPLYEVQVSDTVGGEAAYVRGDTDGNRALGAGEAWVFALTFRVPHDAADPLESEIVAQGQDGDGDTLSAVQSHTLDISYNPSISLEVSAPEDAQVGQVVSYTITITSDTRVGDDSPIRIEAVEHSSAGLASFTGGDVNENELLDEEERWIYGVSTTIQPTDQDPVESQVTVTAFDMEDNPLTASASHSINVEQDPVLQVSLSGPESVRVGDIVTYDVTLTTDPEAGDGSPIQDLELIPEYGGEAVYTGGDADQDGLLEIGETWQYEIAYRLATPSTSAVENSLTVRGMDLDGDPVSASDDHSLKVTYNPGIRIERSGPQTATLDQTLTFTITLTNDEALGDGTALSNIQISDSRMEAPSYAGGDADDDQLLEAGETWIYTTDHTVRLDDPDPLTSTVTVRGEDLIGGIVEISSEEFSLNVVNNPALQLAGLSPPAINFGERAVLVYELENDDAAGDGSGIREVGVRSDFFGAASYQEGDADGDGILEPGETWVYQDEYTLTQEGAGSITSLVTAVGEDQDGEAVSISQSHSLEVVYQPAVGVQINAPSSAEIGQAVSYEILISNDAQAGDGSSVRQVVVQSSLSDELTYLGGDRFSDQILGVDEIWAYSLDHVPQSDDPDPLVNQISVSGVDLDGEALQEDSQHSLELVYNPVVRILAVEPLSVTLDGTETARISIQVENDEAAGDGSALLNLSVERQPGGTAEYVRGDVDGDGLFEGGETWTFGLDFPLPADPAEVLEGTVTLSGEDLEGEAVSATAEHDLAVYKPFTNGDFEAGESGWELVNAGLPASLVDANPPGEADIPLGNQGMLLGSRNYLCSPEGVPIGHAAIQQSFTVPDVAVQGSVGLRFQYVIFSQDTSTQPTYDRFEVWVNDEESVLFADGNQVNAGLECGRWWRVPGADNPREGETDGWATGFIDLSEYRGQRVLVSFQNHNRLDGWYNTYTYLDNIELVIEE